MYFKIKSAQFVTEGLYDVLMNEIFADDNFQYSWRDAKSGSGDRVHILESVEDNVTMNFCIKKAKTPDAYVNWFTITGSDSYVTKFLSKVKYSPLQTRDKVKHNPFV